MKRPVKFIILVSFFLLASLAAPLLTRPARSSSATAQPSPFALKDGDRVLFYGDSITEQRLYTTYVEHYARTHYPNLRLTFINTGWGGDKVTGNDCQPCGGVGGLARLDRDVIAYQPTVVTLLFGMNDGEYKDFDPAVLKVYEDGLTAIIRKIRAQTHARLYVMTPTVYDATRHTPWSHTDRYNEVLGRYGEAAKQIAARENLPVIDLHSVTTEALRRAKEIDPAYTFLPDGVHPQEDGQLVMAAEILRAWGAPPRGIEIERLVKLNESQSANLSISAPLAWPVPLPSETIRRVWPQLTESGRVNLQLLDLPAGDYSLRLDGADAGIYSAEQLKSGISLSSLSRPGAEASAALAELIRKRADLFFTRWRQIQAPFATTYKAAPAAVASVDTLIGEMNERIHSLSQPHTYQITIKRGPSS